MSRRVASMSARSSRSTSSSIGSPKRARRSCWSRASSPSSWASPTASSCCARAASAASSRAAKRRKKNYWRQPWDEKGRRPEMQRRIVSREMTMLIALAAIWIFFALKQPVFLSPRNLSLLMIELSVTSILALGMLLVLLPAQIDLSAGSGVGLTGAVAAVLIYWSGVPAPIALLIAAAGAVIVWSAMGSLIVVQRVPAFIITLGGLLVFKGLHWLTIRNQTVPIVEGGNTNAYSILTTYYIPPTAGYVLAALLILALIVSTIR